MLWLHATIAVHGLGFPKQMILLLLNCFPMLSVIYNDTSANDILKQKQCSQETQFMEKTGTSGTSVLLPSKDYGFKTKLKNCWFWLNAVYKLLHETSVPVSGKQNKTQQ